MTGLLGADGVHGLSNSARVGGGNTVLVFLSISHFMAGAWKSTAGVKSGHLSLSAPNKPSTPSS